MNTNTLKALKARLDDLSIQSSITIGDYLYWLRYPAAPNGNWDTDKYTIYRMHRDSHRIGCIDGYEYCTQDDINSL